MATESVEIVRGIYEAFARGDVPAVLGSFDGEIEWYEADGMPYGGVYRGPEAVAANVFGPIVEDVDEFSVNPEELCESGDRVVALGRYRGRAKESGAALDIPFAHAWTVAGGKATRFHQYTDTVMFREALAGKAIA